MAKDINKEPEKQKHGHEVLMKSYDPKIMKRLIKYFVPYKKWIVLAIILTIAISALAAVRPRLTPVAIDDKIAHKDVGGLQTTVLIILGTILIQGFLQYGMTYLTNWIGQNIIYDLRIKVFSHLQKLSLKFYDANPVGRLITRVTSDVEVLFDVFSSGIVTAFGDIFTLIWIVYFMVTLDVQLTLVTLSIVPLLIWATIIFRKKVRVSYTKIRLLVARLNSYIQEHISGIAIVQLFAKEKRTLDEFEEINREHTDENNRSIFYYAVFFPIVEMFLAVSAGLIIWYGGGQVIHNYVSLGVLISFIQYSEMFFRPIRDLSEKYNILQTAMASSERVFSLMDEDPLISDKEIPVRLGNVKGEIEFKNVWFAYKNEDYVLKDVSFCINPGEKVAFVGATGAGKTTIINLISRFYDVNKGSICLDGNDIRDLSQSEIRKNIAVVLQDVFLFSGSIKNNIKLDIDEIDESRINNAIESTGLKLFIDELPLGIEHILNERGTILSSGQRQLISFARALAYDPKVLILDEATSSVDTSTEILIQNAIKNLIEGRTSIIIAHRLSTIQKCDKIIVMHKGEIKEMGTHNELLEKRGLYYKLYQLQYKEEVKER